MFSFTKDQIEFDIANINIGGQPGKKPTVLFGGVFFKGSPDFEKTEKYLNEMYALSKKTGLFAVPDFFIKKQEYVEEIIDFAQKKLPANAAFSVDIIEPSIKITTLQLLSEKKLLSRTIYNSIHIGCKGEEKEALKKYTPQAAILVAFNPKDKSPDGKIEVLENGANLTEMGLIDLSKKIGIKKILIDTAALSFGDNSGAAIAAIPVIKEEYGLPTGCAIHNVVEKSKWLEDFSDSKKIVDVASNVNIAAFGGDFAIFGPIENSSWIFPLMAWQNMIVSEYTSNYFGTEPAEYHPWRKFHK